MLSALVTGGHGFIGCHLVDALVASHWNVKVYDCRTRSDGRIDHDYEFIRGDLGDIQRLSAALHGVDVVFHLAWSTVPSSSNQIPAGDVKSNIIPLFGLLHQAKVCGISRVVFLSSGGAVYGIGRKLPIPEDHPTDPISSYGITKLMAEKYLSLFHRLHELDYQILRPANAYGENQNPFGKQGVIAVFLGCVLTNRPITIWGDGEIVKDYIYVADIVRACISSATAGEAGRVINIGSGIGVSLNQLVQYVEEVTNLKPKVVRSEHRIFDVPRVVLDISRAKMALGWEPQVALGEGIERVWLWMKNLPRSLVSEHAKAL